MGKAQIKPRFVVWSSRKHIAIPVNGCGGYPTDHVILEIPDRSVRVLTLNLRAVALKHQLHRGPDRVTRRGRPAVREHRPKPARVLLRVSHRPEGGGGEPPLSGHQGVEKAVERVLLVTGVDRHRDVHVHGAGLAEPFFLIQDSRF